MQGLRQVGEHVDEAPAKSQESNRKSRALTLTRYRADAPSRAFSALGAPVRPCALQTLEHWGRPAGPAGVPLH